MDSVDRVKNMVRRSLIVKPDITNKELLDRAREIAPQAVEGLSLRQFHARYRLPIVRHELSNRRKANGDRARRDSADSPRPAEVAASPAAGPNGKERQRSGVEKNGAKLNLALRELLLDFAVELEEADSRGKLVRVVGSVDTWVRRIADIARGLSGTQEVRSDR